MAFKPTTSRPEFGKLEKKILAWWYKSGLVKKYLVKNKASKKRFSFMDGPITANNPMGVHHAWGRTLKDLFQRYKNMRGYRERFQNGFDNQGLWVEVEVEKELGFKSKKDIESYGIGKFVKQCKERTLRFAKVQTEQSKQLGYFMDWDNSYLTMSDENNYMIWSFLKKCWQDGNLYKGQDAVPWCPRCGTAISQHEILTEEYQALTHTAIYLRYPIVGRKDEYLLVWTTTPWTIPGNSLIAANPEIVYALVEKDSKKYWLAASLVPRIFGKVKVLKKKTGEELVKKEKIEHYTGPFDDLTIVKEVAKDSHFHSLTLSKDLVNEAEGTGLVHLSPGSGTEDYRFVAKELKWPGVIFPVVGETGHYLTGYGWLEGKNAKEKPELIFNHLKKKKPEFFLKTEDYTHRYPVCWRCKTELIWRLVEEWYIAMDKTNQKGAKNYRQDMVEVVKQIRWVPGFGLKRELDWLKNMEDWLISKKRYWGLALPIWECPGGHFEVIGSKEELKERAVSGWQEFSGHSPHRPWVDKVKIKCQQCGQEASRIPDVGNPWLDAGIVTYSTLKYRTDKDYWQKWFPADLILECFPGQFKNWFYSLIAMSTVLENKPPAKVVFGHALVRDEKGEEMHKSKGNAIDFDEAAEKMGVDVMRWLYCRQSPGLNLNFGFNVGNEVRRRFHLLLWNVYNFLVTYANVDQWEPKEPLSSRPTKLDLWVLTRLDETILEVTKKLDNFQPMASTQLIEAFVQDLSTWYLRRSRDRVGPTASSQVDKNLTYEVLYTSLVTLARALAPFLPYLSEEIYQNLRGSGDGYQVANSVHLASWPEVKNKKVLDQGLLKEMAVVRKICELGHAARKEAKVKVRQPLSKLTVTGAELNEELGSLIKDELNVKEVVFKGGKGELKVKLDFELTPELRAEGEARELVRQIQDLRKEEGCRLDEKISVVAPSWPTEFESYIKQKTLAKKMTQGKKLSLG